MPPSLRAMIPALASCLILASCAALFETDHETLQSPDAAETVIAPPSAEPEKDSPALEGLLGLGHDGLITEFGEPAFVWTEGDARMWRYDAASCSFLVFLYPDGVRHVDVLGVADEDHYACLCDVRGGCS